MGGVEQNPGPVPGVMWVEIEMEIVERVPTSAEISVELVSAGIEPNPGPPKPKKVWKVKTPDPAPEGHGPDTFADKVAKGEAKVFRSFTSGEEATFPPLTLSQSKGCWYVVDFHQRLRPLAYSLAFMGRPDGRLGTFTEDSVAGLMMAHSNIGCQAAHHIRIVHDSRIKSVNFPPILLPICGRADAGSSFVMDVALDDNGDFLFRIATEHARMEKIRKEMPHFFTDQPAGIEQRVLEQTARLISYECPASMPYFSNRFSCLHRDIGGPDVDESIPGPSKSTKTRGQEVVCEGCGEKGSRLCDDCVLTAAIARLRIPDGSFTELACENCGEKGSRLCDDCDLAATITRLRISNDSFTPTSGWDANDLDAIDVSHKHGPSVHDAWRRETYLISHETDVRDHFSRQENQHRLELQRFFNSATDDARMYDLSGLHEVDDVASERQRARQRRIHQHNRRMARLDRRAIRAEDDSLEGIASMFRLANHPVVATPGGGAQLARRPAVRNPALAIWRNVAILAPVAVAHVVVPRRLFEVSTQHHCSIFVMRWMFDVLVNSQLNWVCQHPLASRERFASVVEGFNAFTRICMHERARRKLGGVIATTQEHMRLRVNGSLVVQRFAFKSFDLSTRELEHLCQMFGFTVNIPQPNGVFINLDDSNAHCGIYQAPYQVVWYHRLKGAKAVGLPMHPIEIAQSLANSFTVSPFARATLLIEPHSAPNSITDAVVSYDCGRHREIFDEFNSRFTLKRLWNAEKTVGNELLAAKTMRKGLIGNLKYAFGGRPLEKGFLQPQPTCSCLIDPIAWRETGHDTTAVQNILTVQSPELEALMNRVVISASATEDPIARESVVMSYLQRLVEKHPFDNNRVLNVALEHDPGALVRLCHDNTALQLITRTIVYRAETLRREPTMFRDIVLDGRPCAVCQRDNAVNLNGVFLCPAHQFCVVCGCLHDGPCAPTKVQQNRICGCGGYDCKKCRIFDGCYKCGAMVCTRYHGKKTERYCPCCTHESMRMSNVLQPIARSGYGVILRCGVYHTKPFCLPRVPGLKHGSFADPETQLKALFDGKWIAVNDTRQIVGDERVFKQGAILYGIGLSHSVPAVPVLTQKTLLHSMITRQLKDQVQAESGYFARLEHFVRTNMETIFGPARNIVPTPFNEWVARFPPGRQKQLRRALVMVRNGKFNLRRACQRVIFGKNEKLEKGTYRSTSDDFSCRVISSLAGYEASVILGPWMHAFGIELKHIFAQGTCMTTACGMDAAQLGECFQEASLFENFMDGDHSKFDSTIHHRLLEIEHLVYQHFGLHHHKNAWRVLKHQLTSRFQIKMMMNGKIRPIAKGKYYGRRNSGDSNTTTGNTIINAVCVIYAAFCASRIPDFVSFYRPYNFRAWVVGDDLMLACSNVFTFESFMDEHKKSGLILEHNLRNHPAELTFCGSRSVPCWDGNRKTRLAIPQFERWGTKIGWSRDPQPSPDAYVQGLAQCWQGTLAEVPLFGDILQKYYSITEYVQTNPRSYRIQDENFNHKMIDFGVRRVETEKVVEDVARGIHVTPQLVNIWRDMIGSIRTLPCIVALPGAELLFAA
jgi:hypothetical protein